MKSIKKGILTNHHIYGILIFFQLSYLGSILIIKESANNNGLGLRRRNKMKIARDPKTGQIRHTYCECDLCYPLKEHNLHCDIFPDPCPKCGYFFWIYDNKEDEPK